ncbi:MAG: molybdopterin-guanine dinucleotide biosynthesis protein B [Planctomycetes bacterium]|nr:molybdopterin-guanine dinucleotide biosynthesis protein B [Planctomycetota bacterium]
MRILSIVGRSGSGKTTLLVKLIPLLKDRGLRVAALKYSHHERVEVDRRGKDSYRLREAGADTVVLLSRGQLMQVETLARQPTIEEIRDRLPAADLLLVESWKSAHLPAVEVIGDSGERVDLQAFGARIAVVCDRPLDDPLPRFTRDAAHRLAEFVASWCRS